MCVVYVYVYVYGYVYVYVYEYPPILSACRRGRFFPNAIPLSNTGKAASQGVVVYS